MPLHGGDLGTAVLIGAGGLVVSILIATWRISNYLGQIKNQLQGLDEVDTLTTQVDTFTSAFDAGAAAQMPDNIEGMKDDMDDIANSIDTLDDVDSSIDTIEAAITAVDLPGIQDAIEELFRDAFGDDNPPIGNSVHYTLENSDIEVAISLSSFTDDMTEVSVRFDTEVQIGSLSEHLSNDNELAELEKELFGREPTIITPSPRQLNYRIHSANVDAIAGWTREMVERLDEYIVQTTESEEKFDEKVGDALEDI